MSATSALRPVPLAITQQMEGWLQTRLGFALLSLAAITPLLAVGFPPLPDLYGHLGRYVIQTDLVNRPELQPFYSHEWQLTANLGADLLVEALHPLLGLEAALRLVVIVTQLLAAAGILLASREVHGRITPFAIAALPLIYGLGFNYGFLNFSLSMALALPAYVLWRRLRRRHAGHLVHGWLAIAGMSVWVCHAYGWAFLGLLCGSKMLADVIADRPRPLTGARHILGACWALLLPVVPMILWRAESGGMDVIASSVMIKILGLVWTLRTRWVWLDAGSLVVLLALVYWAIRNREIRLDGGLGLASLICLAFFLILPRQLFGSMAADIRLMPYVLVAALLAIPTHPLGTKVLNGLTLLTLAFFAGRMTITTTAYLEYENEIEEVLPALAHMPRGSRVAFLSVAPCQMDWPFTVRDHLGGLALHRRSVFVNDQWQIKGTNALTVRYPAAGAFAHDPSQVVLPEGCEHRTFPHLSEALTRLPYKAFTHVWIVGAAQDTVRVPQQLERVSDAGTGALYIVRMPGQLPPQQP